MKIIVDAFGGDNAPVEVLKGCREALDSFKNLEILISGDEEKLWRISEETDINIEDMKILDAPDIIEMCDEPGEILKSKSNSSMAVGLRALANDEGSAFVTAGSTGAFAVGSTFLVKRIKGIKRSSLATIVPTTDSYYMLSDCGANAECRPEMLVQFAIMASCYMSRVMKINHPKVGLINIGAEETKGDELRLATYRELQKAPLNFIGNVEARDLPFGVCDVAVTDGFTGNITLKLTEGMASAVMTMMKKVFMSNAMTKAGAMLVKPYMSKFKKSMDYSEYGGAPLLGISKPVIKAHGSSNANAIKNAIRQAAVFAHSGAIDQIKEKIEINSKR